MAQQLSPWLETAYGWSYGEGNWNSGMDSNLLKFSVMFDRNVDSIVPTLPPAVNGQVHYNTTDNRIYFAVSSAYFSTPTPKWFIVIVRSTGATWQYNGTVLSQIDSILDVDARLDAMEVTLSTLGTAAFEEASSFATVTALDVVEAQSQLYTDTLRKDLGDKVSVKGYGATGDGVTDDTAEIQAAINALVASQGFQTTLGAITGGYVSNVTPLIIPRGIYKISDELVCPAYFKVIADNAVIVQTNPAKDIFANPTTAYQWEIEGVHFSGGRCHANMGNANVDVTRWTFRNCTFSLSSSYAVRAFPSGGASSHLSANLLIKDCAFYKPRQALLNYCDSATIEDCWVFVSKDNFDPSTPVFENGSLTCDGYPNLYMRGMFGVPAMGTHGVDRLANVRWCDLLKGGISADRCRFGGEFAGMPVVYNLAANNPVYPFIGPAITIHNSECFGGPSAAADSGIVSLQAQIPARISIHNCLGPVEVPYITNAGNQIADIPAYFAAYELASGQKAYSRYTFDIRANSSLAPDGSVYGVRVPAGMRPYCNERRQTKVSRAATQVLANGFASNVASFDTVDFDSQGGFDIANPTRIVMPDGATSMRIQAYFSLDGGWTGNTLRAAIVDSSLAVVTGQGFASDVNADDTQYTISADVFGSPGDWWAFEIKHNAVAAKNMIKCTVTTSALDYIS